MFPYTQLILFCLDKLRLKEGSGLRVHVQYTVHWCTCTALMTGNRTKRLHLNDKVIKMSSREIGTNTFPTKQPWLIVRGIQDMLQ